MDQACGLYYSPVDTICWAKLKCSMISSYNPAEYHETKIEINIESTIDNFGNRFYMASSYKVFFGT